MFKFFKWFGADNDVQREEVKIHEISTRTERIGMDKNFRVGKVKHISADKKHMLIDVAEYCHEDNGLGLASYNLWIYFDPKWERAVKKTLLGKYVVVGFYIQSFRNKDLSDSFTTVLTCRFLNEIEDKATADLLSLDLTDSRLFVNHPSLKLRKENNHN